MFRTFLGFLLGPAVMFLVAGDVQAQPSVKPPDWPAINSAAARLDSTIEGLDGPGLAIAYSEPAGMLAIACEDQHIYWWFKDVLLGIRSGKRPANLMHGHQGAVVALAWEGGPVLASASADRKLILWAVPEGKPQHTISTPHFLRALALSPDSRILASAGDEAAVQLWDVADGKPAKQLRDHTDWLLCLAFSPDGKFLASGGHDTVIRLWDVGMGTRVRNITGQPEPAPKDPPLVPSATALTFSPDSKHLFIGRADGTIEQVNVADGKLIRKLAGHGSTITCLVLHPTGNLLVSSSKDRTVRLWNPANGQAIKTLEGHTAWVQGVVFVARGTRLASVGADRTVRLWDLTEPPKK